MLEMYGSFYICCKASMPARSMGTHLLIRTSQLSYLQGGLSTTQYEGHSPTLTRSKHSIHCSVTRQCKGSDILLKLHFPYSDLIKQFFPFILLTYCWQPFKREMTQFLLLWHWNNLGQTINALYSCLRLKLHFARLKCSLNSKKVQ